MKIIHHTWMKNVGAFYQSTNASYSPKYHMYMQEEISWHFIFVEGHIIFATSNQMARPQKSLQYQVYWQQKIIV